MSNALRVAFQRLVERWRPFPVESKLMLGAYNNEAANAVRAMKPYTLELSIPRLQKARETITRLGRTMNIMVTYTFHRLLAEELDFTADYLAKSAEEKEQIWEERARLKEEAIAGHVYVISNVGSSGPHMAKIGMTRRLEPMGPGTRRCVRGPPGEVAPRLHHSSARGVARSPHAPSPRRAAG